MIFIVVSCKQRLTLLSWRLNIKDIIVIYCMLTINIFVVLLLPQMSATHYGHVGGVRTIHLCPVPGGKEVHAAG